MSTLQTPPRSRIVLPDNLPSIKRAKLPELYESAKQAMTRLERIDECQDWADKMAAMASYAKQADDKTLLETAIRIQGRAIKRCGQLMREMTPDRGQNAEGRSPGRPKKNGADNGTITRSQAARAAGLSKRQQNTAIQVSNIPDAEFERLVESDNPPTVTELAKIGTKSKPKPLVDLRGRDPAEFALSTRVQGALSEFRKFCEIHTDKIPAALRGAFEDERDDMRECLAPIRRWLDRLEKGLQ
jgi:predicted transcriptional regulator